MHACGGKAGALGARCRVAIAQRPVRASDRADELMALASSTGMREIVVRAYLHYTAQGAQASAAAARILAQQIDSPSREAPVAIG